MPATENISPPLAASSLLSLIQENSCIPDDWDALISQLPAASCFHRAAWIKVLADTYRFTPVYLTSRREKNIEAALPILEVDSWVTGKRGTSLPFTDECPALGLSRESISQMVQAALKTGRARGWKSLELRGGDQLFNGAPPSVTFHGHKLNLAENPETLFGRFESSVRRALRKAEKSGLRVEFSHTLQAASEYYALHCQTRKEHGLPPQPFDFFRRLHELIIEKNLGVIVTAKLGDRPVASAIFLFQGSSAVYKFGASDKAALDARANNLVMWEAIKWLASQGVKELCFGRTSLINEGLRRYKLGWGTEEYAIHYYKYDFRANAVVPMKDEAAGWHNALFRALPSSLARCAGKMLYRHAA